MTKIKRPTLEEHAAIAHDICTTRDVVSELYKHSRFFYANEIDKLTRFGERDLGLLRCRLDDVLFTDYPELSNDWTHLYYGTHDEIETLMRWRNVDVSALYCDLRERGFCSGKYEHAQPLDVVDGLYQSGALDMRDIQKRFAPGRNMRS